MEIRIDPEGAKEIVHKAILELLDEKARNELIAEAVKALTARPPKPGYGAPQPPSPLENAFEMAVRQISVTVVREYLEDEIVANSIREQILAVLKQLIDDKGNWLYDQIGYAVGQKITEVLTEEKRY